MNTQAFELDLRTLVAEFPNLSLSGRTPLEFSAFHCEQAFASRG